MKKYHLTKLSLAALLATAPVVFSQEPAQAEIAPVAEPAPALVVEQAPAPTPVPEVKPIAEAKPEPAKAAASGTKISLYGFAQLNAVWEDGVLSTNQNNWNPIAPSNNKDGGSRTLINVNHTRFGINFSDSPTEGGTELSGKIEADFNNSSARSNNGAGNFRIRHSYGQVKFGDLGLTILFGQTGNVFSPRDPSILSEGTMNYSGNIGSSRVPQIRLTQALGPAELAVAAVDDRGAPAPSFPGVQGRVGFKTSADWADAKQNLELGVSGHFASEKNTDTTDNQTSVKVPASWSVNADLNLPIMDILGLSGEFFYGQNLRNYANGSLGLTATALDPTKISEGDGVKSFGFWASLGLKLPASLSLNGGLGMESIANDDDLRSGTIDSNMGIFANLRYNFIPSAFVGVEYWHISTSYKDVDDKGAINRIELAFNYTFK
ncbi:MAG: hypothetical protein LBC87_03875 [Fibromonadaceae bacterium]|jgi:hypothetical protein|nr:hypothetical protein [Fibromonadaceae bacterium]